MTNDWYYRYLAVPTRLLEGRANTNLDDNKFLGNTFWTDDKEDLKRFVTENPDWTPMHCKCWRFTTYYQAVVIDLTK